METLTQITQPLNKPTQTNKRGRKKKQEHEKLKQIHISFPKPVLDKLGKKLIAEISKEAAINYYNSIN